MKKYTVYDRHEKSLLELVKNLCKELDELKELDTSQEVVDARGEYPKLDDRLNVMEDSLSIVCNDITNLQDLINTVLEGSVIECNGSFIMEETINVNRNITLKNGVFRVKDGLQFRPFQITSPCKLENITVIGNQLSLECGNRFLSDLVAIDDTHNVIIENCTLSDSYGGGISLYRSSDCIIKNNIIRNIWDNGIIIAEKGADRNIIDGNNIRTTHSQNCIFLTASSGSDETEDVIYDNKVINNICSDSGDTCIECGINTVDCLVQGNTVETKNHSALLFRDSTRFICKDNQINTLTSANGDSLSVVPHYKGGGYSCRGLIEGNIFHGSVTRSCIGIYQNYVDVKNNKIIYDNEIISSDGSNLKGTGILLGGNSYITIEGNTIENFDKGIYTNYGDSEPRLELIKICNNTIKCTKKAINLWNSVLLHGKINDNTIIDCYEQSIKDGNGDGTTEIRNNKVVNINSSFNNSYIPNNTFVRKLWSKHGVIGNGQYSQIEIIGTGGVRGKCSITTTEGYWALFDIQNGTIHFIRGEGMGVNDSDVLKVRVTSDGMMAIQTRVALPDVLHYTFNFEE